MKERLLALATTLFRVWKRYVQGKNYFVSDTARGKWFPPRINTDRPILWFDVFSGGEATQISSLARTLKSACPRAFLVVTTNNRYAADFVRSQVGEVDLVWDSPWDFSGPATRFLRRIAPKALIFVENCTLPVLAKIARDQGVPTMQISALIRAEFAVHPLYQRPFAKQFYRHIDRFLTKSPQDAEALRGLGVPGSQIQVGGNLKYDAEHIALEAGEIEALRTSYGLNAEERVLLGGSLHAGEPAAVLQAYQALRLRGPWKLFLVPRYLELLPEVEACLRNQGLVYQKESQGVQAGVPVTIIDTFGKLARLYNLADLAVLGGSLFRRSPAGFSQNLVEPVLAGCPVIFGPFTANFQDLSAALEAKHPELRSTVELLPDRALAVSQNLDRSEFTRSVRDLLNENKPAVDRTVHFILKHATAGLQGRAGSLSLSPT